MKSNRLLSLDLFRGLVMFLLVAEGTGLYHALADLTAEGTVAGWLVGQFHHHPWNGLRFWDLIQPYFMFIVGVAMVYSVYRRWERGDTWSQTFTHIIIRCVILFFLGVILHCGYNKKMVWELWNVLTQLSFTILVSFLLMKLPLKFQIIISFAILGLSEFLYRIWPVEGYNQPFTPDQNFGSWMDMKLMGHLSGGHWVAINALPTTAHTMWGVIAGRILRSTRTDGKKLKLLLIGGAIGVVVGYGLDIVGITPIIKRICTSSFVIASGSWALLTLAFIYWLVDMAGFKKGVIFFAIVGMNPIFIYLFSNTVGGQWFNGFVGIFSNGFLTWIGISLLVAKVFTSLIILTLEWLLCYWLYKREIFFKI